MTLDERASASRRRSGHAREWRMVGWKAQRSPVFLGFLAWTVCSALVRRVKSVSCRRARASRWRRRLSKLRRAALTSLPSRYSSTTGTVMINAVNSRNGGQPWRTYLGDLQEPHHAVDVDAWQRLEQGVGSWIRCTQYGMNGPRRWQSEAPHHPVEALPIHSTLGAPSEPLLPNFSHLVNETPEGLRVPGNPVVPVVPSKRLAEVLVLLSERLVTEHATPFRHSLERPRESALGGGSLDDPRAFAALPPVMVEAEEVEGLRRRFLPVFSG